MASAIRTRLLIISDTHGKDFKPEEQPQQYADVAIHCGDLTEGATLKEFRTALKTLKSLNAPLKLVIAGNHDFTMDISAFESKVTEAVPPLELELVIQHYGDRGEARRLFDEATDAGIRFLDEGTHCFTLVNAALLTVYASPFTPSPGAWGFQYRPEHGYTFAIEQGTDVVITHGPPRGIMDYTYGRERAGCPDLFASVALVRPRIHCFEHIHEGWGARLVTWRDHRGGADPPNPFTAIDNERSPVIEKLSGLQEAKYDSPEDVHNKAEKLKRYQDDRCCRTSHCAGDDTPLQVGKQTLFVNASISGTEEFPVQMPWLVDIELPRAC